MSVTIGSYAFSKSDYYIYGAQERQSLTDQAKTSVTKTYPRTGSIHEYLQELKTRYPELNIFVGKSAEGSGLSNLTIAPNIIKEMAENPEAAMMYEKMVAALPESERWLAQTFLEEDVTLQAHGFILDEKGGMSSWGKISYLAEEGGFFSNTKTHTKTISTSDLIEQRMQQMTEATPVVTSYDHVGSIINQYA